jgi:hypothetical protein
MTASSNRKPSGVSVGSRAGKKPRGCRTSQRKKEAEWATIRVSPATLEAVKAIAAAHNRPYSWVAAQAVAAYAVVQDLNEEAKIGRRLEVRA